MQFYIIIYKYKVMCDCDTFDNAISYFILNTKKNSCFGYF